MFTTEIDKSTLKELVEQVTGGIVDDISHDSEETTISLRRVPCGDEENDYSMVIEHDSGHLYLNRIDIHHEEFYHGEVFTVEDFEKAWDDKDNWE